MLIFLLILLNLEAKKTKLDIKATKSYNKAQIVNKLFATQLKFMKFKSIMKSIIF